MRALKFPINLSLYSKPPISHFEMQYFEDAWPGNLSAECEPFILSIINILLNTIAASERSVFCLKTHNINI